ncbi:MAG TPA: patatin-like phospholipase family protein, partial [Azospira sp.]|nr:patatin-like phospholipase family protein [Azospira sp.]
GQSVSFYQGGCSIEPWERAQRVGARARLGLDHLMASCAIPFIFPAVKLNREWFGDGSMRQLAPIAPAIHLGAERILVVAAGRLGQEQQPRGGDDGYPSLAQVAGHALSSIFLDGLAVDIERLTRINRTLAVIPEERRQALALRPIQTLVLSPSQRLDHLAARHARSLPWAVKVLLSDIGALRRNGGALTSYLLFQADYTQALMELGHRDTLARSQEVRAFLDPG